MCNPTSQPPRRDMYELETSMAATERPSFLPKPKRIGTGKNEDRIQIYNGNYAPSGYRIGDFDNNWTVIGPDVFAMLPSHAAALAYAFAQMPAPDPAPQEQASVTTGWTPPADHEQAWQEKWNLTR